jgi:hypothetical protein
MLILDCVADGVMEVWKYGSMEVWKYGSMEVWKKKNNIT